ncbi:MAG TPA: YciI family protein [Ktedonobacterales bacterium]|nr:YciI family protein [Ktedonobacterales bacterium]
MWEFEGDPAHNRRFLIIGRGKPEASPPYDSLRLGYRQFAGGYRRRLIACGPLLSDDGVAWVGGVILAEVPDRAAVDALLEHDPGAQAALYQSVEIHHWRFGGRPTA